ncbi:MAG: Uma2 family endonuclease [Elainella sp.]
MTQAKLASFEEYLAHSNQWNLEGRYELIDGALVELPPESRFNSTIAVRILLLLIAAGTPVELVHPGKCEVQVPVLQAGDAANRFPDLVVLRPEHLALTQRRLTITRDMPPPLLIVEVVSPGSANQQRDYQRKRQQYEVLGVLEYWLVDPALQTVTVLHLQSSGYRETGSFQGQDAILSPAFPSLSLTAEQLFSTES